MTVKVTLDDKGQSVVEAFQVSQQCMEMVAEGVLEISTHLGSLKVNPTFTAVVEGKNTTEVSHLFSCLRMTLLMFFVVYQGRQFFLPCIDTHQTIHRELSSLHISSRESDRGTNQGPFEATIIKVGHISYISTSKF